MDAVSKNFGDQLEKFAEVVDLLDSSNITNDIVEITITVNDSTINDIAIFLGQSTPTDKCLIEIGKTKFTFLKK